VLDESSRSTNSNDDPCQENSHLDPHTQYAIHHLKQKPLELDDDGDENDVVILTTVNEASDLTESANINENLATKSNKCSCHDSSSILIFQNQNNNNSTNLSGNANNMKNNINYTSSG
jgi:hypothetical protein